MELDGVVHNGVIVPDDATVLPEGTRVRISPAPQQKAAESSGGPSSQVPQPFGQRFAQFKGAVAGLPADLASQHDHDRLGTPKR
jgi:hypothetical protein